MAYFNVITRLGISKLRYRAFSGEARPPNAIRGRRLSSYVRTRREASSWVHAGDITALIKASIEIRAFEIAYARPEYHATSHVLQGLVKMTSSARNMCRLKVFRDGDAA